MRVGFVTFYPYRPHVEHMEFLAAQLKASGDEIYYLICRGRLESCSKNLGAESSVSRFANCEICKRFGLKSYPSGRVITLDSSDDSSLSEPRIEEMIERGVQSSIISYLKLNSDFASAQRFPDYRKLLRASYKQFNAVTEKIRDLNLDKLIIFNGRLDFTAAAVAAALHCDIDFYTVERSWLGFGLNITRLGVPLDLKPYRDAISRHASEPLTPAQYKLAELTLKRRFEKESKGEFRQFNAKNIESPTIGHQIAYLPSSIFERALHPDWAPVVADEYAAIDEIRRQLGVKPAQLAVRAHPQWQTYGLDLERYHQTKCREFGFHYYSAFDNTNTSLVIERADIVLVNGSSTAFEAGFLGKTIINLSPTFYDAAHFCCTITSDAAPFNISVPRDPQEVKNDAIVSWYSLNFRKMSLTDYVIPRSGYSYSYRTPPTEDVMDIFHNKFEFSNRITNFDVYASFGGGMDFGNLKRRSTYAVVELVDRWTRS